MFRIPRSWLLALATILSLSASSLAKANGNILFMPSLMYLSEKSEQDSAESESSSLYINATLGYLVDANFGLGLKYFSRMSGFKIAADDDGAAAKGSNDLNSLGFGVFYDSKSSFFASLFYLHEPTKESGDGTNDTVYTDGYGYWLEAAYKIKTSGSVEFGPLLSYAYLSYEERESDTGVEKLEGTWADRLIVPYFALWLYF